MQNSSITLEKLNQLLKGWQDHAPDKSFGGMTLAEFKVKVKPSFDARESIEAAKSQWKDGQNRLANSDVETLRLTQRVVNAIKGDPDMGDDSSLYEAAGYVRRSERKSGLGRKAKTAISPQRPV